VVEVGKRLEDHLWVFFLKFFIGQYGYMHQRSHIIHKIDLTKLYEGK